MVYSEKPVGARAWLITAAVAATAFAALTISDPNAWIVAAIIVGMIVGIIALTLWSMNRYSAITVTEEMIRVGRDRMPVTDLDPWSLGADPTAVPGSLAGGAYARPLGQHTVQFRYRDGRPVAVATTRPEELNAALERVFAPYRR